ncbi:MAG: hypothetical protein QOC55_2344, partial [Thermoleophilaceae bacterium]|nr:hypothetical protein [Thermoleophilaceae bacterium]
MERIDPAPVTDERTALAAYLAYQRATVLTKAAGLDQQQLGATVAPSSLTLAGLVKHLAYVEDFWVQAVFLGVPDPEPWASAPFDQDPDWEFHSAPDDSPDALVALYVAAAARTDAVLAAHLPDDLSTGTRKRGGPWTLRWIVLHLIEETARHAGHAD